MKPTNQFRNLHILSQYNSQRVSSEIRQNNDPGYRVDGHSPVDAEKNHTTYSSTETKSFTSVEKKKPDLGGSGSNAMIRLSTPPIIAYPELNANGAIVCAETAMSYDNGYIRIPRSLLDHCMFMDAKPEYQALYLIIYRHAAIYAHDFNDNGKMVRVEVGEVCYSIDQLKKMCSKHISRQQIERGIVYFRKCHFLGQRPGYRRSILKITHPESYELILNQTGTRTETRPRQDRDTNRESIECKEQKKKITKKKPSATASVGVAVEDSEMIKIREAVSMTQKQIDSAKAKFGEPLFEAMADRLNSYKITTGKTYARDYGLFIQGSWLIAEAKKTLESTANPATGKKSLLVEETALSFLQGAVGHERVTESFGMIEVFSNQGYSIGKFAKTDLEGAKKWYANRNR